MSRTLDYVLTFAGAGTQEIQATGRHVRVLESPSASVFITLDGSGSELKRGAGQGITEPGGFSRVRVRSDVAQTVRVTVADVEQDDSRASLTATIAANVTPGNQFANGGDVSVGAGVAAQLLSADATRLAAIITNPVTNTAPIRVGTAGVTATSGIPLDPGESVQLAVTTAIYAFNTHPGAQTVTAAAVQKV